jgi:hypothetical protein
MIELPKTEIIIHFLKFLSKFLIFKHFNYPRKIQNIYHNYCFKFNLNFLILKP